jgi:chemotaxis protein methyltransferase CheR
MQKLVGQFHECLLDGAWLLVGPTEPNMTCFTAFEVVNAPGVTMYRKVTKPSLAPVRDQVAVPPRSTQRFVSHTALARKKTQEEPKERHELADIRHHADRGKWVDALACCQSLLQTDSLNSLVHFYHALVLDQTGRHTEAEAALRRAIYLDRRAVLAHYYLGLSLQSRGDPRDAVRSFENTIALLDLRVDTDVFPDADGITVGDLKKLALMQLEVLRA